MSNLWQDFILPDIVPRESQTQIMCVHACGSSFGVKKIRYRNLSNNTGTTHYDSLQESYWADQKDSHYEVIMTSL